MPYSHRQVCLLEALDWGKPTAAESVGSQVLTTRSRTKTTLSTEYQEPGCSKAQPVMVSLCLKHHTLDCGARKMLVKFTSEEHGSNASRPWARQERMQMSKVGQMESNREWWDCENWGPPALPEERSCYSAGPPLPWRHSTWKQKTRFLCVMFLFLEH